MGICRILLPHRATVRYVASAKIDWRQVMQQARHRLSWPLPSQRLQLSERHVTSVGQLARGQEEFSGRAASSGGGSGKAPEEGAIKASLGRWIHFRHVEVEARTWLVEEDHKQRQEAGGAGACWGYSSCVWRPRAVTWKDRTGGIPKGSTTGLEKGRRHGKAQQAGASTVIPYSAASTQIP